MVFSSFSFLFVFFPALLLVYFLMPRSSRAPMLRDLVLLGFSLMFYAFSGVKFLLLMLASIGLNYAGGLAVSGGRGKKPGLILTVTANLLLLGWFKYAGFFAGMIQSVCVWFPVPEITLPVGISFFTFQGMSYVIDVYRGDAEVQKNPFRLALYVAFFPQLIAGPIIRYDVMAREMGRDRENLSDFAEGLTRFCFGLAKKMLLANAFGEIADAIFIADAQILSTAAAWIGAAAYTAQIYFDFSGYSDMAIGLGRVFGFHFPENFDYPYISRSVTEFWRRWHISLSSWFRDYVYIPLGGSRVAAFMHIRNILIVWALTGLWHGAAWNFVLWGLWYGLLLLGEKYVWKNLVDRGPKVLHWLITMVIVIVGWVLFRAESLSAVTVMLKAMFGFGAGFGSGQAVYYLLEYWPEWIAGILAAMPIKKWLEKRLPQGLQCWGAKLLALVLLALSYMQLITGSFNPFLYFRF